MTKKLKIKTRREFTTNVVCSKLFSTPRKVKFETDNFSLSVTNSMYGLAYLSDWDGHVEFYCDGATQCRLPTRTPVIASAGPELCDQTVLMLARAKMTKFWSCMPLQNYVEEKRTLHVWSPAMQSTSGLCCGVRLETSASVFLSMPVLKTDSSVDVCRGIS